MIMVTGVALVRSEMQLDVPAIVGRMAEFRSDNKVWMSTSEQALIESYLSPTDVMLEYGSGHSTLWFSQFVKSYYSIEHNAEWYDAISQKINKLPNVQYQIVSVEKGHKGWPGGFAEGSLEQFQDYIKAVDNFNVPKFDRVLIDGRARAECAKYILKYLHEKSLIFIHDFEARPFYHENLDAYYVKVAVVFEGQSVVVARPKLDILQAVNNGQFEFNH
jgi:hypothetical protein